MSIRKLSQGSSFFVILVQENIGRHVIYLLPKTAEEYIRGLGKSLRTQYRRRLSKIEKEYAASFRVLSGSDAVTHYPKFLKLHSAQWRRLGRRGHFGDWPGSIGFNRDLIARFASRGCVRFDELALNGRTAISHYSFVFGERCFSRLTARDTRGELLPLGVGQVGGIRRTEALIGDGVSMIESGPGRYDHKASMGGQDFALRRLIVARRSVRSVVFNSFAADMGGRTEPCLLSDMVSEGCSAARRVKSRALASLDSHQAMKRPSRRCPSLGLSPVKAFSALLAPRSSHALLEDRFGGRRLVITQSCRTAIALLREALALDVGDEIIVSAYNCGTEIDALFAAGLTVRFVDSDNRGFLDPEVLTNAIGQRTRAIYVIHPFGWPQPIDIIDAWRRAHNLFLIEDCALAPFSDYPDGSPVGSKGEASVFSFPKSLPTPDGGALWWNTNWAGPDALMRPPTFRTLRQIASRNLNWARRHFGFPRPSSQPPAPFKDPTSEGLEDIPENYYFQPWRWRRTCCRVVLNPSSLPAPRRRR